MDLAGLGAADFFLRDFDFAETRVFRLSGRGLRVSGVVPNERLNLSKVES